MKGQTETDVADHLCHEAWATTYYLGELGFSYEAVRLDIGHPLIPGTATVDKHKRVVTVVLKCFDDKLVARQVALTVGELHCAAELFAQRWDRWVKSIFPDPGCTQQQFVDKEKILQAIYESTELFHNRLGLRDFLIQQGIRLPALSSIPLKDAQKL
jgi:hypothetical protein